MQPDQSGDVLPEAARFILDLAIREEDKKRMLEFLEKQ
jgi:hypothetical protein